MASETDLMSSVGKKVEDIMNQAVTGQTGSGMIDSEEEMMDGAGAVVLTVATSLIRRRIC